MHFPSSTQVFIYFFFALQFSCLLYGCRSFLVIKNLLSASVRATVASGRVAVRATAASRRVAVRATATSGRVALILTSDCSKWTSCRHPYKRLQQVDELPSSVRATAASGRVALIRTSDCCKWTSCPHPCIAMGCRGH